MSPMRYRASVRDELLVARPDPAMRTGRCSRRLQAPPTQLNVTPSGDCATPLSSPQSERSVRMPISGGDAIHWPLGPQASVAPDASRPKLYRVF